MRVPFLLGFLIPFYGVIVGLVTAALARRWEDKVNCFVVGMFWPFTGFVLLGVMLVERYRPLKPGPPPKPDILEINELVTTEQWRHAKQLVEKFEPNVPIVER